MEKDDLMLLPWKIKWNFPWNNSIFSFKPLKIDNDIMEINKINDIISIENWIEEEALKGTLRLKANGYFGEEKLSGWVSSYHTFLFIKQRFLWSLLHTNWPSEARPSPWMLPERRAQRATEDDRGRLGRLVIL